MRETGDSGVANSSLGRNQFINLLFVNVKVQDANFMVPALTFLVIFLAFLSVGIFLLVEASGVVQVSNTYYSPDGSSCAVGSTCNVSVTVTERMEPPIRVMFRLGNYYQETVRYVQSKSNSQLAGNLEKGRTDNLCAPIQSNADMEVRYSWNGTALDGLQIASPCGSIAKNFFNDSYALYLGSTRIAVDESDIAFSGDKGNRYKRTANSETEQWVDPQDEHFMVWMRMSGLPNFKILWGKIDQALEPNTYNMVISNNYRVEERDGTREIILTTWSAAGGKNYLLPSAFLLVAVFALGCSLFFWRRYYLQKE